MSWRTQALSSFLFCHSWLIPSLWSQTDCISRHHVHIPCRKKGRAWRKKGLGGILVNPISPPWEQESRDFPKAFSVDYYFYLIGQNHVNIATLSCRGNIWFSCSSTGERKGRKDWESIWVSQYAVYATGSHGCFSPGPLPSLPASTPAPLQSINHSETRLIFLKSKPHVALLKILQWLPSHLKSKTFRTCSWLFSSLYPFCPSLVPSHPARWFFRQSPASGPLFNVTCSSPSHGLLPHFVLVSDQMSAPQRRLSCHTKQHPYCFPSVHALFLFLALTST